jgi:hypothetical protein
MFLGIISPKTLKRANFFFDFSEVKPILSHISYEQKQILAQQPGGVRAFPFGISRQICFFSEVGLFHMRKVKIPNLRKVKIC